VLKGKPGRTAMKVRYDGGRVGKKVGRKNLKGENVELYPSSNHPLGKKEGK